MVRRIATVLMMAYPLEMAAEILGWWSFQNIVVTSFGLITGLAWGLFTMPILHAQSYKIKLLWDGHFARPNYFFYKLFLENLFKILKQIWQCNPVYECNLGAKSILKH